MESRPILLYTHEFYLCLVYALDVFAGIGIYAQHIAFIDEEGGRDGSAGFKDHALVTSRGRITLHCRRRFNDLQIDLDWNLDRCRFFLVRHDFDRRVRNKPFHLVRDRIFRERKAVLRVTSFSEPGFAAVRVEVIRINVINLCFGNGFALMERYFSYLAGDKVAELGLVHRLALLHAENVRGKHLVRLTVIFDDLLLGNFVIGKDCHSNRKILNKLKRKGGARSYKRCPDADITADWGMIQDVMRYSKSLEELETASDEEVLLASLQIPDAFAILLNRYEAAFLRRAQHILYSKEDAEEVVQDTFTRIYLYANRYATQEGAQFSSWAYTILTRQCFTRYQKLKKERGRMAEMESETFERLPDSQNFLDELSIRNEVVGALSKLPESCARLLRLQFLEGKTQEEIAQITNSSVPAVKTRVFRAKKLLKQALTEPTP